MTLPSQFARPTSRHTHMFRRRRGRRRSFLLVLLLLLGVTAGVWLLRSGKEGPAPAVASQDQLDAQEQREQDQPMMGGLASAPIERPQIAPSNRPTQPEIRMGEPAVRDTTVPPSPQPTPSVVADTIPSQASPTPDRNEQPRITPSRQAADPPAPRVPQDSPARSRALERMRLGMELLATNRPVEARQMLTQALLSDGMDAGNARQIRATLSELNDRLVFSPEIVSGDPFAFGYTIRPGDALSRLPRSQNAMTDWRFIQRINRIQRPQAIRAGQHIKLVSGPFHAVVYKRQFRMDVFLGESGDRVYVRSFSVGLGEYDSTPVGTFRVRQNSKLINPEWTNSRTGERFLPDDPMNPIGEHWIGLEGISEGIRDLGGYGIHGTIEPQSIGRQASMGCVRMASDDVALVYELLVEGQSTVEIVDG